MKDDPVTLEWELKFIELLETYNDDTIQPYVSASRSFSDALGDSISGDLGLVFGAIGLIFLFTAVSLGRFGKKFISNRSLLAFVGVATVFVSVYAANGLCAYMGVPYVPPNQVIPFLIIGIGVDDMFILTNEVEATPPHWPNRRRMAVGVARAGASITLTSVTNVLAFLFSALTSLPAIQSFAIHAAVAVLLDFIFQLTFFTGALSYDLRRTKGGRLDCVPCVYVKDRVFSEDDALEHESFGQRIIRKYYAPNLVKLPVKILVVILSLGLLGVGIYGTLQLDQDFRNEDLINSSSDYYNYIKANDKYFYLVPESVSVYIKEVDYTDTAIQDEILQIDARLRDIDYVEGTSNWVADFHTFCAQRDANWAAGPPSDQFYNLLDEFLLPFNYGVKHGSNIIREEQTGQIVSSNLDYQLVALDTAQQQVAAMKETRAAVDASQPLQGDALIYSFPYVFWEQYAVIVMEAIVSISSIVGMVIVVTLVFLIHPWAAAICTVLVGVTLIYLTGFMYFWGLSINSVTVANIIFATGFAVDYVAHITHAFMVHHGTKEERVKEALHSMGISVISGGFSTFLGVVLLSLSSSGIFVAFFKEFMLTILGGLWNGLVLLPVLLTWIGPSALPPEITTSIELDSEEEDTESGRGVKQLPLDNQTSSEEKETETSS
jgi:predicted RND superfamily exporter protein